MYAKVESGSALLFYTNAEIIIKHIYIHTRGSEEGKHTNEYSAGPVQQEQLTQS